MLAKYERASVQQINCTKTTIFFSKLTNEDTQTTIQNLLGVNIVRHYEKYLGLPSFVGRKKKRKVSPISSSKCGREFKGGRVSYSVKQVGRY